MGVFCSLDVFLITLLKHATLNSWDVGVMMIELQENEYGPWENTFRREQATMEVLNSFRPVTQAVQLG